MSVHYFVLVLSVCSLMTDFMQAVNDFFNCLILLPCSGSMCNVRVVAVILYIIVNLTPPNNSSKFFKRLHQSEKVAAKKTTVSYCVRSYCKNL